MMKKVTGAFLALLLGTSALHGATLLPNGQQQFIDANGKPYASGKVYFYSNYPTCTVLKNTYQDSAGSVLNTNPVILDAAGRATIFGSGAYCQVLKDQFSNTIWTKYTSDTSSAAGTSWGGTSGGTANAQTISSSSFTGVDGQTIYFVAGFTNTGALTLTVSGATAAVVKTTLAGPAFLTGGEVTASNLIGVTYVSTTGQFQLVTSNVQRLPGEIKSFAGASCPSGWVAANGAVVSQTTYAALYSAIGSTWNTGGEGAGNFRLPDLRGTFLRGSGTNATGSSTGAVGQAVGTYAADTYLNHNHTDAGHSHGITFPSPYSGFALETPGTNTGYYVPSGVGNISVAPQSVTIATGYANIQNSTTGGTETKPKNYGVAFCMQY